MSRLYRYPALILLVCALITVFFAFQLPRLELDNNNFRFISPDDPARRISARIDDTFGSSVFILVALRRRYGDVFDAAFLQKIRDYVEKIEAIEIIEPVSSMVTADYISGDNGTITVEKLLPDDFSGTEEEIAVLKEKLLSWDMYKNSLVSDDFSATQILVPMNISSDEAGLPESVDSFIRVRDIALEMFAGSADVYVTGIPVISATINEAMRADLVVLIPVVILVVLLALFFSFRNFEGIILPLITVIIAAVWSVGAIPVFGIKLSVVSTVLPVILVAVGSAYGIHVFAHYLDARSSRPAELDRETHRALVIDLVRNIARPVFLAALTTFAGFLSFCFTTVLPIREFGFFACFGVLSAFVIALTVIPALILLRGPASVHAVKKREGSGIASFFSALSLRKEAVLCVSVFLIIVSAFGASKLIIDNVFIEYFRSDTGIYQSDVFVRETFGGSKIISVVAEADSSETLLLPESLLAMDNMASYLERHVPDVGKVMGFTDLIKRVNQVFNAGESPEGVAAKTPAVTEENGGFGFEDGEFGFGESSDATDFGFDAQSADTGDFGFYDAASDFEKDEAPPASVFTAPETGYSSDDVIALISRAARSASSASPGAEELVGALKKLVNYEGASYYEIPANPARYGKTTSKELAAIVSNYLVLLSGDVDDYADDPLEPRAIKSTVQLRTVGEEDTLAAIAAITAFVRDNFPPNLDVTIGGTAAVEVSLNQQVVRSQLISLIISFVLVFFIIALSNKSFVAGCIGIVPFSISILIDFAVMGFLGIKLNIGTSMIASLAVGIGVDYTIHYLEAFKRESKKLGRRPLRSELPAFLRGTFAVSGRAIIINAASVGAGFAVLLLSGFIMLKDFGLLVALTMLTSALVSLTVLPALLLALKPRFTAL